jgi:hypothetical protein
MAMRVLRTALLAGVAAVAIGFSGAATAQSPNIHVMTVRLPGGGSAEIRYTGEVAPQVVVSEAPATLGAPMLMPSLFGSGPPFAMLDRISAEMDRRAAAMFREADALAARASSGQLTEAALRNLPPGSRSYSFVSTMSGNGVCTRSVEITSMGNGAQPRVVSHSSGNCGPTAGTPGSINLPAAPAPVRARQPDLVLTKAGEAKPYAGMVRRVAAAPR